MQRVYIETSVWGMVRPDQNPVLREPTLQFMQQCEARVFQPSISDVVLDEIRRAPPEVRGHILPHVAAVAPLLLPLPPEVELLAQRFIDAGVLTANRREDARHVACALVNKVDLLVSWNYRHIANVRKAERFNAVAVLAGMRAGLQIHTPLEVLEWA